MKVSVIICTHNPREDYLHRALEALKAQTLPQDQWELLLIDNASKERLSEKWDLTWHPAARHIREEELGLTPARLRGIREAAGEILVFVDDDNILDESYLHESLSIALHHPWVGSFNGIIHADYEISPPVFVKSVESNLAIRNFDRPHWSCRPGLGSIEDAPCGAGLVVRKSIADHYSEKVMNDPLRRKLDRKGASLLSCGDSDLALTACELQMATGGFPTLKMNHLIPSSRLNKEYLIKLEEGISASYHVLKYLWAGILPAVPNEQPSCRSERIYRAYKRFRANSRTLTFEEHLEIARRTGRLRALQLIEQHAFE